ncbi:hypothetical protein CGLO_18168 [Colletotrichum gloeosporioides Cg-14]|uniref:Uncharacterized protein n=1 Tax=Colletotrichum gloeosporioides (strain Cg-14) TaxID=1237896 RepID=T0JS08_COLGC|nr:hypothetical protein CGLO_18168 [Colletotrichum gloeosporioides Cg-14]
MKLLLAQPQQLA